VKSCRLDSCDQGYGSLGGSCERSNDLWVPRKAGSFLTSRVTISFKKDLAAWNEWVTEIWYSFCR